MLLFIGDLHLGNLYADVPGFYKLLSMIASEKHENIYIVLLGDVIEGVNKYRTQIYKMFNIEPLRVQMQYFSLVVDNVVKIFRDTKLYIYVVLGNHDLGYDYGNVLSFLARKHVKFFYETLIINAYGKRILCKHQLNRMSRGSYLTWWSGYLINLANKMLQIYNGDMIVTAHTHRPDLAVLYKDGKTYIGLPSFIVSHDDYKENKILGYNNGWFKIYTVEKTDRYEVERYNIDIMRKLIENRESVSEITL